MNKIAIIGLGWLGFPLAENLISLGYTVLGTTTKAEKKEHFDQIGIECIILDLNKSFDEKEFQTAFADCTHCVINIPPSKLHFQTYQTQCVKLLDFFTEQVKFIFVSSTGVYSEQNSNATEDSKKITDFNFSSQLFLTEKALQKRLGKRLTILRMAGLAGGSRNPARFLAGKENLDNGKAAVNLVHLEDCIRFISVVISQNSFGEIFNVCASEHPTREEFYTWACMQQNLVPPTFLPESKFSKTISNKKGKEVLNFTYKFDSPFNFL